MGSQQVLRAVSVTIICGIAAGGLTAGVASADTKRLHEKAAIVDLGPGDQRVELGKALVAAGLDPVVGEGVEDALAGQSQDPDGLALASAMATAQQAFGSLDCKTTVASAARAVELAASRQAAGLPVPELARAYALELSCADRDGDIDAAMRAAARIRVVGGSDPLLAKYPEVDAVADREMIDLTIDADVPGADVWVDHQRVGAAPVKLPISAGDHIIAVAKDTRRGVASGTAVRSQPSITVPTTDQATKYTALATRIASWHGRVPAPDEIAAVLDAVHTRVVVIRHGDVLEAWGRIGHKEVPHKLGSEEGTQSLSDATKVMALVADRAQAWNDHAPDPDQPLLLETPQERALRKAGGAEEEPTKWWVYATVFGAAAAGALIIYAHDRTSDTQHIEVHFP